MKLNLQCFCNGITSYSILSLEFLNEMIKQGVDICLFPLDSPQQIPAQYSESVQKTFYRNRSPHAHHGAPSLQINHQFNLFHHVGSPRVGFTVLELDECTTLEQDSLLCTDLLITSNNYHADVLRKYHGNVKCIPLGVNHDIFNSSPLFQLKENREALGIAEDSTVFLNVGKIERRKCHRELCEAFNLAFDPEDNVSLIMICENGFLSADVNQEWKNFYKNSKMGNNIHWLPKLGSQNDIAKFMKLSDCLVAPSRAEGFNLPVLEAMACGKSVITTNVTAMADYCSKNNAHLIELNGKEKAYDKPFFNGQGSWYRWEQKHTKELADHMRHIHHLKEHDELEKNINGLACAASYSWENVTRELIEAIYG